jgi:hypothetical protein
MSEGNLFFYIKKKGKQSSQFNEKRKQQRRIKEIQKKVVTQ